MTLTPEQKQALVSWLAAGDNLSVVQKKLSDEFKISITYMDLRFLLDDLGLELKNTPVTSAADTDLSTAKPAQPAPGAEKKGLFEKLKAKVIGQETPDPNNAEAFDEDDSLSDEDLDELPPGGAGQVKIDVDRIVRPGAVASGSVTFSDGVKGKWSLDQYGRLILDSGKTGYQPPASDIQAFQRELSIQLQRHGF
ncbi:MAG: hypothetical protein PHQ04_09660 [Opitutaceae bacterium]|nr:hypothetical protein [Opitutaceae bacterium]